MVNGRGGEWTWPFTAATIPAEVAIGEEGIVHLGFVGPNETPSSLGPSVHIYNQM
jgi:hypothetical protein